MTNATCYFAKHIALSTLGRFAPRPGKILGALVVLATYQKLRTAESGSCRSRPAESSVTWVGEGWGVSCQM